MAHFAVIDAAGTVLAIHVVANAALESEDEAKSGAAFLSNLHGYDPSLVIQCSYNGTIRGCYPGIGHRYDADLDEFVGPLPLSE